MKDKILELLEKCYEVCTPDGCKECKYHGLPNCGDQLRADALVDSGLIVSEQKKCNVTRDYEADYNRLLEKYNELYSEHISMETEFVRLRAQMDVVHLIFGGK